MSLRSFYQAGNYLPHYIFMIVLFGLGYFNLFLMAEPISIFFQVSSLVGQLIVNKFLTVCSFLFDIVKLICAFFQILYEDSLIFVKDAIDKLVFVVYLLKECYFCLEEFGWNLFNTVYIGLVNIFNFLGILQCALGTIKQRIHHTGSDIWCFFTNIPVIVHSSINAVYEFTENTFIEIRIFVSELQQKFIEFFKKTYLFLFDVPFDSICGLIVGAVLITVLCVKFKSICYIVSKVLLKLFKQATSVAVSFWNGSFLESKTGCVDYNEVNDERLCIVCQFRLKEIIIFPCKHLCLCVDCSGKLMNNQAVCPLCRRNITETLKVYV